MNEKITQLELDGIRSIENEYGNAILDLGYISFNIENLKKKIENMEGEKENILRKLNEIENRQNILLDNLKTKYGNRSLNIETGELI
jgi:hypothetical protein